VKKLAYVSLALLATLVLSLGLSWLLHLASKPSDMDFAAGLGGSMLLLFLYWEVLRSCVTQFRREIRSMKGSPDPTPSSKELSS